jgi:hypothetical protein
MFKIYVPKGTPAIFFNDPENRKEWAWVWNDENEILFPRNSKLKIKHVREKVKACSVIGEDITMKIVTGILLA